VPCRTGPSPARRSMPPRLRNGSGRPRRSRGGARDRQGTLLGGTRWCESHLKERGLGGGEPGLRR
jgi:hypothetical protein